MANEQLNQLLDEALTRHDETLAQFGGPAPVHLAEGGMPYAPTVGVKGLAREELNKIKSDYDAYNAAVEKYNADSKAYADSFYTLDKNPVLAEKTTGRLSLGSTNGYKYYTANDKGELTQVKPSAVTRQVPVATAEPVSPRFKFGATAQPLTETVTDYKIGDRDLAQAKYVAIPGDKTYTYVRTADLVQPVLPTSPAVTQEQYQAKMNAAKQDATARQTAVNVAFDPASYGLSMNRLFSHGGAVHRAEGSPEQGEVKEPWLPQVSSYSELTAQDMYPGQGGQFDQRDAARHMLAAGTLARKYGPGTAELLGKAHEITTSPFRYIGSKLGMVEMPVDYEQDLHNNKVGIELARRSKSQKDLEDLVMQMAEQHRMQQTEGKAWTGKPVRKRADGSPEEGESVYGPVTARRVLDSLGEVGSDIGRGAASNAESLLRGAISQVPGTFGDLEALGRKAVNWSFGPGGVKVDEKTVAPTSEEIRAAVPRGTPTRMESAGMESMGEVMAPGLAKAAAPAAKMVGKETARQVLRGMEGQGPLASITPSPMYAVRPDGGGVSFTGTVYGDKMMSKMDAMVYDGQTAGLSTVAPELKESISKFWEGKAKNYLTRQMGTADDPLFNAILRKDIKGSRVEEHFPEDRLDAALMGKTRVNPETGEERFFPKYPNVIPALTKAYDELTGIKGVSFDKAAADPRWTSILSDESRAKERLMNEQMVDKIMGQTGLPPNRINPNVQLTGQKPDDAESLVNSPGDRFKQLHQSYLQQQRTPDEDIVPQHLKQAIESGEPIYDIAPRGILSDVLSPDNINKYLKTLEPKQIDKMRFDDVVKNSAKYNMKLFARADLERDIRGGKRVPDTVFTEGVSKPIMQFGENSTHPGFAWKRIEKDESTVPEGAYLGHSVGGYAPGGMYGPEKNKLFNEGKYQVYTLRDNKNRPVNTVEVRMDDENTAVVTQIKGNGRASGNTAPTDYDQLVKEFLIKELKPVRIDEMDKYLTPLLIDLKNSLPGQ